MNDNIDQEEIKKFDQIAQDWWNVNGPMKPLHQLNPLRIRFIAQHCQLTNQRILDVGCGAGILAEAMAKKGALVTGIDMSTPALKAAKAHASQHQINLDYMTATAEDFAQQHPQAFDTVTCLEMLEHVPDPSSIVAACQRLVKPGGKIFFSTINRNPQSFLMAIVGVEYILRLLPKGTHEYAKLIRPSELNRWAEHNDLTLLDITGIHYNPITEHFSLKPNINVNYIACYENNKQ